jgi:hypothetical protein
MNTNTNKRKETSKSQLGPVQAPTVRALALKLGLDVHADRYGVVRQLDGNTPQPAQTFTPAAFLDWVKTQLTLAERVYTCYEAGPFGYGLPRDLTAFNLVEHLVTDPVAEKLLLNLCRWSAAEARPRPERQP